MHKHAASRERGSAPPAERAVEADSSAHDGSGFTPAAPPAAPPERFPAIDPGAGVHVSARANADGADAPAGGGAGPAGLPGEAAARPVTSPGTSSGPRPAAAAAGPAVPGTSGTGGGTAAPPGAAPAAGSSEPAPARHAGPAARGTAPGEPAPEPERVASILRQIRLHLDGGARQATLQLVPAELGRISVRLRLERGRLAAEIRAESAETRELLERHAPELRAALAREGFDAPDLSLGGGAVSEHGAGTARDAAPRPAGGAARSAAPADDPPTPARRVAAESRLDLLA